MSKLQKNDECFNSGCQPAVARNIAKSLSLGSNGFYAIWLAAYQANISVALSMVEMLLAHQANPNPVDPQGVTLFANFENLCDYQFQERLPVINRLVAAARAMGQTVPLGLNYRLDRANQQRAAQTLTGSALWGALASTLSRLGS